MKNHILLVLILGVILIIGCTGQIEQPPTTPSEEVIVVKQSGGATMLVAECADKSYISENADYIVEGIVKKTEAKWNDRKTFITTYVDIDVEQYVKGSSLGDKLQIRVGGGCVGNECQSVEDQPIFDEGKRIRMHFHKTETEFWIVCAQFGVEEI